MGIEFLNKSDKLLNNYLIFSLSVNDYTYPLCDSGIKLAYGDYADSLTTAKQTTTKTSTTKESTTKQTTTNSSTDKDNVTKQSTTKKETTTKFKYTYTTTTQPSEKGSDITTEKTTKQKIESTTKFKYTGDKVSDSSGGNGQNPAANGNSGDNGDRIEENTTAPGNQSGNNQVENGIIIPETGSAGDRDPQAKLLTAMAVICGVAGAAVCVRNLPRKKNANENNEEE